jgi:hypothetical protein
MQSMQHLKASAIGVLVFRQRAVCKCYAKKRGDGSMQEHAGGAGAARCGWEQARGPCMQNAYATRDRQEGSRAKPSG